MDNNIVQTVFNSLDADTAELKKAKTEYSDLDARIKAGRYSDQALEKEIYPKRDALLAKIRDDGARAIDKARKLVAQYREDVERLDELDPSAITDDIKLLQAGIPLLPRDINAILERNKDNRTMLQLALRYAKEHNIAVARYIGGNAERETANRLDNILSHYEKWIEKDNANYILRKFFKVE